MVTHCKGIGISIALFLAAAGGAWADQDVWQFRSSIGSNYNEPEAVVFFNSSNRNSVYIAFKCEAGEEPYMLLVFMSPIYEGMADRLRVHIKVRGDGDVNLSFSKLFEAGVPSELLYAGIEAEVHKLWFLSDKMIRFRTYGGHGLHYSLIDLLRALRDGRAYAELSLGRTSLFHRYDPRVTTISLRGSARAIDQFAQFCGLVLDHSEFERSSVASPYGQMHK